MEVKNQKRQKSPNRLERIVTKAPLIEDQFKQQATKKKEEIPRPSQDKKSKKMEL